MDPEQTPRRGIVHMVTVARRHVHPLGLRKYQANVFLLSSDDPGSWDPKEPVAVEPSLCPITFQELSEREPPEVEVAPTSILHVRVVRELTSCSISVNAAILVEKVLTICGKNISELFELCIE